MESLSYSNENGNHTNGHRNGTFDSNGNGELKSPKKEIKDEEASDDDIPWGERISKEKTKTPMSSEKKAKKRKGESDSEEDYKPDVKSDKKKKKKRDDSDDEEEYKPEKNKKKKEKKKRADSESGDEGKPEKKKSKKQKRREDDEEDDEIPLSLKFSEIVYKEKKPKKEEQINNTNESSEDEKEKKKKAKKEPASSSKTVLPTKRKVKKEEQLEDTWEWWKEDKKPDGVKWNTLEHKGPLFAPNYIPLPKTVVMNYDGNPFPLSPEAEEVAGFYAAMLEHEYTTKDVFNKNFFKDWRKTMTSKERETIVDLKKCDFRAIEKYLKEVREERKAMSKEEKQKIKEEKEAELKMYGIAIIDGHKQKVANFRIEPPGLFRGRGGHPKMGKLKKRIVPEDVIINCSKNSEIPKAPAGHKWKEVRHDNTVTWLCSWTESVLGSNKYIMLNPSSKIKGEKDYEKYETARRLKKKIKHIRDVYTADFKSKEMRVRQRAVALYFIDKLALRAGNEKDVDEAADTVGCCSLRVEHIKLYESAKLCETDKHEKEFVVEFDFLGKDSIRYFNRVPVEKRVFKNLKLFMENKSPSDDLFDRLDTSTLNEHLRSLMPGLTVKVFRTYNASITLQEQLMKLTDPDDNIAAKILSYNRANRQVAILCNHQRAVPKTFEKSMENLETKIKDKKADLAAAKLELEKATGSAAKDKAKKKVERLKEQLKKLKISRTDKDENKQVALGTSKLNYLDPRITVAWCKKFEVPLEKVFNKTHREKFRWAIDMTLSTDEEFIF